MPRLEAEAQQRSAPWLRSITIAVAAGTTSAPKHVAAAAAVAQVGRAHGAAVAATADTMRTGSIRSGA